MLLLLLCFKLLSYFNLVWNFIENFNMTMVFFVFFFLQILCMFLFYCLYMHILMSDLKAHWSLCCNVSPTLNKAYCIVNKYFYTDIYCDIKWQKLYGCFSTPNALRVHHFASIRQQFSGGAGGNPQTPLPLLEQ
jgi:hypothetical protein